MTMTVVNLVMVMMVTTSKIQPTDGHPHSHTCSQTSEICITLTMKGYRKVHQGVWELHNDMVPKTDTAYVGKTVSDICRKSLNV